MKIPIIASLVLISFSLSAEEALPEETVLPNGQVTLPLNQYHPLVHLMQL